MNSASLQKSRLFQQPSDDIPKAYNSVLEECLDEGLEDHYVQGSWKRGHVVHGHYCTSHRVH